MHIVFASVWGLWMTQAHLEQRSVLAATLKGFIVILNPHDALPLAAAVILAAWLWRLRVLARLARDASQDP